MTTDTSRTEIGTGPTSGSDASPPAPPGRPWSLWAGSALLGALGLLLAGTGAVGDEPEPAMAAVGVVVLVAAVLPLVLRVVGWWVAVVVCGLLAALVLMGLSADPNGALAVGACWVAVTGALLLLARPVAGSSAARVEAPARDHAVDLAGGTAPAHGLRRPEGWTAEWAGGWVKFVLMSLFGGFCLLVGGLLTVASLSSDPDAPPRGTSVLALAFGAAVVAAVPIFWPRRTARPELRDLSAHGSGSGVAFPYSRARTRAALVGSAAFALTGVALLVYGDTAVMRVVGGFCTVFFGFVVWVQLRRRSRRWALVASPLGVGLVDGPGETFVPWAAVRDIVADEVTTYHRGIPVHEPHIALLTEPGAVRHEDAVEETLAGIGRRWSGADAVWTVRALAVDPVLVLSALRHYLHQPDQRAELGGRRALERIARGDLLA